MSRYLIVTAISFTAFNAVTLPSLAAEQAQPQTVIEVAQAPDGPPPDPTRAHRLTLPRKATTTVKASVAKAAAVVAVKTAPALAALHPRSKRSPLPLRLCNRRSLRRHHRQLRRATTMTAAVAAEAVGAIAEKTDLAPGGLRPHSRRSPLLRHPSNRHSLRPRSVTTPIAESVAGAANVIAVGLRPSSKHSLRRHRRCNRRSRLHLRRCRSPSCQCNRRNLRLRRP